MYRSVPSDATQLGSMRTIRLHRLCGRSMAVDITRPHPLPQLYPKPNPTSSPTPHNAQRLAPSSKPFKKVWPRILRLSSVTPEGKPSIVAEGIPLKMHSLVSRPLCAGLARFMIQTICLKIKGLHSPMGKSRGWVWRKKARRGLLLTNVSAFDLGFHGRIVDVGVGCWVCNLTHPLDTMWIPCYKKQIKLFDRYVGSLFVVAYYRVDMDNAIKNRLID